MVRKIDWESQIGRRLKLRDLHVFFVVAQEGSLAKAASRLRVSQPAVSQLIADLEHSVGAKLFDRSSRGVALTIYGRALIGRGRSAFDELKRDGSIVERAGGGRLVGGVPYHEHFAHIGVVNPHYLRMEDQRFWPRVRNELAAVVGR